MTYSTDQPSETPPPPASKGELENGAKTLTVIEAGRTEHTYWRDFWRYRELLAILAWRDIAVRYKQTIVGIAWAVLRPLLTMLIFTFVFGRLAQLPSDGSAPYSVMVYAGMLPWFLFATILSEASNSLVNNIGLISKVYFPRLIIPASSVGVALVEFLINATILVFVMAILGFIPSKNVIFLPIFVGLAILSSIGPALMLSALNVKYRDFRFIVPFIVQFGLYVSPVGFSSSVVPESLQFLYNINPMVGVIDGFRWCLLGGEFNSSSLTLSLLVVAALLWIGTRTFRRAESAFSDFV